MTQYDRHILNKLLDTYESSLLFTGENSRTVHIEFRFGKKEIPAYFEESSQEYEKIHIMMKQLEEKQLIRILWKGNREGHIISKVRLNTERLDEVYEYVHRTPKNDMESESLQLLASYTGQDAAPVCRAFAAYLKGRLGEHKSVKEFVDLGDAVGTKQLLDTVQAIETNETQLYIREFSMLHFHDSKAFEKMAGKAVHVFKRFQDGFADLAQDEILAEYGIYHTPNYVYLKGTGDILIGEEKIRLTALKQGLGISGDDIANVRFFDTAAVKRVITIENLTTYFRWWEENSLLVYLGGYHNLVRRELLREIYSCYADARYYHFGDIDAGGFEIYRNLREKTGIPFEMYHMDRRTLQAHEDYCKPLTENDRRRLRDMENREELKEVVAYMLEHDVKLEQECISMRYKERRTVQQGYPQDVFAREAEAEVTENLGQ